MTDNDNGNGGVQKGHAWREFALAPEMVRLPSGNYLIGENEEDKFANATERPRHRVEINYEWAICRYPITQGEFYAFDRSAISQFHLPVVDVSWLQAVDYCAWLAKQTGRPYGYRARLSGNMLVVRDRPLRFQSVILSLPKMPIFYMTRTVKEWVWGIQHRSGVTD
jgi:hypothetical protein